VEWLNVKQVVQLDSAFCCGTCYTQFFANSIRTKDSTPRQSVQNLRSGCSYNALVNTKERTARRNTRR
jgi:hypothetical protein